MRVPRDNSREFLKRITPSIHSDGARNLNEISRNLSIPYQTLRFRMLHLGDQGITVHPIIDLEKIGLTRYRVALRVSNDLTNYKPFFGGLHQKAGLWYYARSEFTNLFDCEFAIPIDKEKELRKLLDALKEMKIINNVSVSKIIWKEVLGLRTEHYDYINQEWDVDFTKLSGNPSVHKEIKQASDPVRFDRKDLLVMKSLQTQPWIKSTELSEKLRIHEADIAYHMNNHVFAKGLISGFVMKWAGTKEAWSKHSIVPITLVFKDVPDGGIRHAMSIVTSMPFTWNHMELENSGYAAELLVPLQFLPDTMHYFSEGMRKLELSPEVQFADPYCLSSYTIPYLMFDHERGWVFKVEESLGYVLQMIRTYG